MTPQDELAKRRSTFLRHCHLCRVWGVLAACDAALTYPHLSWSDRQRLLGWRAEAAERPRLAGLAVGCLRSITPSVAEPEQRTNQHPWGRSRRLTHWRQVAPYGLAFVAGVAVAAVAVFWGPLIAESWSGWK